MTTMADGQQHARGMHRYGEVVVAQVCHAALRELRLRTGELAAPPWEDMDPVDQVYAAEAVLEVRRGISAASHHDSWVTARLAEGWALGPKDPVRKTHPDLVPFAELPPERRVAARMFLAIVTELTDVAG